ATSFGQGSTVVSPASLAIAAATIARGHYVAPQLVLNGKPADCSSPNGVAASAPPGAPSSAASASVAAPAVQSPAGTPLPPGVLATLHSLMREVVTSGTAPVLQKAPGAPVMAKTGTAEYGSGSPPKTH